MNYMFWDRKALNHQILSLKSCLCVGLDSDPLKLPSRVSSVLQFNMAIVEATLPYAVAYKINSAFYEVQGAAGWDSLIQTIAFIQSKQKFVILDAKRGDIGNTASLYARTCFETLNADAVTVAPYMGKDSVTPFLDYARRWTILLALTSNSGAADFQLQQLHSGEYVFEKVLKEAIKWGHQDQLMFVAGATKVSFLQRIRSIVPDYFLLIPGIGAQGGDLSEVMKATLSDSGDILINASRSIIYASGGLDYASAAAAEAHLLQKKMSAFL